MRRACMVSLMYLSLFLYLHPTLQGTYDDGLKFIAAGGLESRPVPDTIRTSGHERYKIDRAPREESPHSDTSGTRSSSNETDVTPPSTPDIAQPPLHIMFLGSSLGNFSREEGPAFLRSLPLRRGCGDTLLLGLDHGSDAARIETAYDDPKGYTRKFILNGLKAAGGVFGDENMFDEDKWEYVGRYNEEERKLSYSVKFIRLLTRDSDHTGRHEAYYKSKGAQSVFNASTQKEIPFLADEMIKVEVSYKVSEQEYSESPSILTKHVA